MKCKTTEELSPLEEIVGQKRAVRALKFGLGIGDRGFNVYVAGLPGTGRTTAVRRFLEDIAGKKTVPSDWCYVNNFNDPYRPQALKLPPGEGGQFADNMKHFIEDVRRAIPRAFDSEDYANKRDTMLKSIQDSSREILQRITQKAEKEGFAIQSTRIGLSIVPVVGGKPLTDQQVLALPTRVRKEIEDKREVLEEDVRSTLRQVQDLERKAQESVTQLNHDVALFAINSLVSDLLEKYSATPEVKAYLEAVRNDIVTNFNQFLERPQEQRQPSVPWVREVSFRKYEVNVVVDNSALKGAPVIRETNPIYPNLLGRIEREALFGALTTDFTMIRGGALHRANGGYLVMPVLVLLRDILAYEGLKKSLQDNSIRIEEAGERLGYITTKSLRPEPIPLDVKVVLIGDPNIYQQLYAVDPEFAELFKVKADFDTTIDRDEESMNTYAAFLCTLCEREKLRHLDSSGVDKVVEYSARIADHQDKLSTRFSEVADIVREANFYATQDGSDYVTADHVRKAVEEKIYRSNLIQEKIQEAIQQGVLLIDIKGETVGQVNGLSVLSLGDFSFGTPGRVTASIGLGREGLVDIQREAKLAGPIYTKGVMILGGYLAEKYAQDKPLTLSARLVFEQSYGMVEGDSASSTELYALLSSLSGLPIKQNLAVTGSVNQKGEVQAIGGADEKIEGFFEVCKAKGLTGDQGVIIPESNVQHLMLKEDVVDAVRAGKFHVFSVKTIDEGIELLTGVKAGKSKGDGTFEEGTVNYRVNERLKEMGERLRKFGEPIPEKRKEE